MKSRSLIVLAMALSLAAGTAEADDKEKNGKGAMAAAAKVTIDQAIKAALEKVPGKIIEAELEKKQHKLVWEIEVVTAENKVAEVYIDADTGTVISVEGDQAEPKRTRKQGRTRVPKE